MAENHQCSVSVRQYHGDRRITFALYILHSRGEMQGFVRHKKRMLQFHRRTCQPVANSSTEVWFRIIL